MRKWLVLLMLFLCFPAMVAAEDDDEEKPKPVPQYFELTPSLVSNLVGGPKYIRFEVQFMYYIAEEEDVEVDNATLLSQQAPALRHELLMTLVDQDGAALARPDGKEAFRKKTLAALQALMEQNTGRSVIEDLYFTSFYVK